MSEKLRDEWYENWVSVTGSWFRSVEAWATIFFASWIIGAMVRVLWVIGQKLKAKLLPRQPTYQNFSQPGDGNSNFYDGLEGLFDGILSAIWGFIVAIIVGGINAVIWGFWTAVVVTFIIFPFLRFIAPWILFEVIPFVVWILFSGFIKLIEGVGKLFRAIPGALEMLGKTIVILIAWIIISVKWIGTQMVNFAEARKKAKIEMRLKPGRAILENEPALAAQVSDLLDPSLPEELKIYLGLKEPVKKSRKFLFKRRMMNSSYARFLKKHYS
jgi:hypothetical protein